MAQVYDRHLWGGTLHDFYSGDGSHTEDIIGPYLASVSAFLKSFSTPLTVCDLGCGDFNIGHSLVPLTKHYIGVGIVPNLVERNRVRFTAENLEFQCLDIAKDPLPNSECAFLRQVLQHLSNAEVLSIAEKLTAFKYVVLTEHIPNGSFTPNLDIISGQGTRLKKRSGIRLIAEPFNLKVKNERTLCYVKLEDGIIETILYEMF